MSSNCTFSSSTNPEERLILVARMAYDIHRFILRGHVETEFLTMLDYHQIQDALLVSKGGVCCHATICSNK